MHTKHFSNKNFTTKIASLRVGESDFVDIKGSVMDKKVRFPTSVLGNDVLKRFNVLVDFPTRLYLFET